MDLILDVAISVVNAFNCSRMSVTGAMISVKEGTNLKVHRRRWRLVGCMGSWSFDSSWYSRMIGWRGVRGWEGGDAHHGPVACFLYCEVDRKKICVEIEEVGWRGSERSRDC